MYIFLAHASLHNVHASKRYTFILLPLQVVLVDFNTVQAGHKPEDEGVSRQPEPRLRGQDCCRQSVRLSGHPSSSI
jgi:hypothetical protein